MMSNKENDKWLEAAKENFEEAIEADQWDLAKDILADMKDKGFEKETSTMRLHLIHKRYHDR